MDQDRNGTTIDKKQLETVKKLFERYETLTKLAAPTTDCNLYATDMIDYLSELRSATTYTK